MSVPQRIAAVPAYIPSSSGATFMDSAPGQRFQAFFRNWQGAGGDAFAPYKGKARVLGAPPPGLERRAANEALKREFDAVLNEVCDYGPSARQQVEALRTRQAALISALGPQALRITTTSTAPFATGLGNEHPIENGFAFLTPYGLPYLAGSGVKGIVRRAMQELARDGEEHITPEAIDALFGPELDGHAQAQARRGALDFWDVFPSPAGGRLVVEVMTPHFGEYYRGNDTPHDAGSPVPVSFLAVPARSQFDFHVVCNTARLPEPLQSTWRALVERAFQHAFDWVGFGAKTSVGYGAMAPAKAIASRVASASAGTQVAASPSPGASDEIWAAALLTYNPGTGEIKASFQGKVTIGLKGDGAKQLFAELGEELEARLRKKKELRNVAVRVELQPSMARLRGLHRP